MANHQDNFALTPRLVRILHDPALTAAPLLELRLVFPSPQHLLEGLLRVCDLPQELGPAYADAAAQASASSASAVAGPMLRAVARCADAAIAQPGRDDADGPCAGEDGDEAPYPVQTDAFCLEMRALRVVGNGEDEASEAETGTDALSVQSQDPPTASSETAKAADQEAASHKAADREAMAHRAARQEVLLQQARDAVASAQFRCAEAEADLAAARAAHETERRAWEQAADREAFPQPARAATETEADLAALRAAHAEERRAWEAARAEETQLWYELMSVSYTMATIQRDLPAGPAGRAAAARGEDEGRLGPAVRSRQADPAGAGGWGGRKARRVKGPVITNIQGPLGAGLNDSWLRRKAHDVLSISIS